MNYELDWAAIFLMFTAAIFLGMREREPNGD
jgi:hypothetical protein